MNFKIKELEKRLGYKIKKDIFCLAIDTATKSGIAMIMVESNHVEINSFILKVPTIPNDTENKSQKYEECLSMFLDIVQKDLRKKILPYCKGESLLVLENSFLSKNVWTYGFLKCMMGILYAELHDLFNEVKIIFPVTARNLVGFKSKLPKGSKSKDKKKEIMKWVSNIIEEPIKDDNCADALILAFAGLKEE